MEIVHLLVFWDNGVLGYEVRLIKILWRIDLLLCNDREMGGYTKAVSG
jgi:hypothetical protein